MVLKYYYDMMSQPSRSVYIFLELNNIPYESHPVALRKDENKGVEFTKINPFQKVPVIDDDGFILGESIAILQYLAQKYKVADHWYPVNDNKLRARVDEYTQWHHINTRFSSSQLFLELMIVPMATGQSPNQQEVKKWEKNTSNVVSHLDTYFLKDHKFLCGDSISIADLLCICELTQLNMVGKENIYLGNEKVRGWAERVQEACGSSFADAHKITKRVRSAYLERQKKSAKL